MSRLTITLSEARYRALKEAAAQRSKTIGQLIDESLDFYGIKSREQALDLVRQATPRSPDPGDQLLWDLLAPRPDLLLVTGDKLLLQDAARASRVLTAQALAERLQH